ncbi:MAG: hypothetical protein K2M90_04310, partial [Treponemataceae bacterium]|nr:hypothetical protein [Treponemataceae bacterium]
MMKKISKLALLAAATAFLLAAFPACSDEDDGNEPTPTVKPGDGDGGEGGGSSTPATAKEYNFVGLAISDFPEGTITAKDDGNALSAFVSGADNYIKTKTEVSVKDATLYGGKNNLRIRATNDVSTALNYNGGESADISSGATISDLSRYVKIHIDGAGTVTASIKAVNSSNNSGTLQIALVDKAGNLIGDLVPANVAAGKIAGSDATTGTVTGTVTAATDVYL